MLHFFFQLFINTAEIFCTIMGRSVLLHCEKKRVLIIASLTLKETSYVAFVGPIFQNTIETCLNSVEHGGYE